MIKSKEYLSELISGKIKLLEVNGLEKSFISDLINCSLCNSKFQSYSISKLNDILKRLIVLEKISKENISVTFDYIRVRVEVLEDVETVLSKLFSIIGVQKERYVKEFKALYGYYYSYIFDNIKIYVSKIERMSEMGILLELSGKGCRQLNNILYANKKTLRDFFIELSSLKVHYTRIDICLDDVEKIIDLKDMKEELETNKLRTYSKVNYPIYKLRKIKNEDETVNLEMAGVTIYLGSRSSEMYICFYEKDEEQIAKGVVESEKGNRYEIRFTNEKANVVVNDYIDNQNLMSLIGYCLSKRIIYTENTVNKFALDCIVGMLGVRNIEKYDKEEDEYIKRLKWLENSARMSMCIVKICDEILGIDNFERIFDNKILNKKCVNVIVNKVKMPYNDIVKYLYEKGYKIEDEEKN